MQYVIQSTDTSITKLATKFGVEPKRWPEFCAANPKLVKDPNAGCLYYVGKTVNIPDSWVTQAPGVPAPPGTAIPQPIGPPVSPPGAPVGPVSPAPSSSMFATMDTKKVMLGAAAVAAIVVAVYAIKRKGGARAAA